MYGVKCEQEYLVHRLMMIKVRYTVNFHNKAKNLGRYYQNVLNSTFSILQKGPHFVSNFLLSAIYMYRENRSWYCSLLEGAIKYLNTRGGGKSEREREREREREYLGIK